MNGRIAPKMAATIFAAAMLAACGGTAESANNDAVAETGANAMAAPAAPAANETVSATPAAVEIGGAPTVDYMVGKWSAMDEDCSATIEFKDGGTVTTPIGDAKYTVAGDKLSIDYGDGSTPTTSTIRVLSPDRIEITRASGGKETEKRC